MAPQKACPPPKPHNITGGCDLIWKMVFAGIIKDLEVRSSWITHVGPKSNDKCPYKRQKTEGAEKKRRPCEHKSRVWSFTATAKKPLEPPEAGRGEEGFFPRNFGESLALLTLNFRLLASTTMR